MKLNKLFITVSMTALTGAVIATPAYEAESLEDRLPFNNFYVTDFSDYGIVGVGRTTAPTPQYKSFFYSKAHGLKVYDFNAPLYINDNGQMAREIIQLTGNGVRLGVELYNTPFSNSPSQLFNGNTRYNILDINNDGKIALNDYDNNQGYIYSPITASYAALPENGRIIDFRGDYAITQTTYNNRLFGPNGYTTLTGASDNVLIANSNGDAVGTSAYNAHFWQANQSAGVDLPGINFNTPNPNPPLGFNPEILNFSRGRAVGIYENSIYGNIYSNSNSANLQGVAVIWDKNDPQQSPTQLSSLTSNWNSLEYHTQIRRVSSNGTVLMETMNGNVGAILHPVPEPGTLVVFGIGIMTLLRRRAKNNHKAMEQNHQPSSNTTKERQPEILSL